MTFSDGLGGKQVTGFASQNSSFVYRQTRIQCRKRPRTLAVCISRCQGGSLRSVRFENISEPIHKGMKAQTNLVTRFPPGHLSITHVPLTITHAGSHPSPIGPKQGHAISVWRRYGTRGSPAH